MDDVAYVPGLSRNLLSTIKAVEQWGKPLIYYRNEAVLGFPGEESLVFKFCPRKGTALAMRAGVSRDVMEVHRTLAYPSEDITRKTAEMMGI